MISFRLLLTPQTNVRATQRDKVLFRIPEECPYTLKVGNTITVVPKDKKRDSYKGIVHEIKERVVRVKSGNIVYTHPRSTIVACDGIDCKHKLTYDSARRLKRLERYNDYKDALLSEARRIGMDLPGIRGFVVFYMPMPIRWNKKMRKEHHMKWHEREPDIDNMEKAFLDGLMKKDSGIAFLACGKKWVDNPTGWIEVFIPEYVEDMIKIAIDILELEWKTPIVASPKNDEPLYNMAPQPVVIKHDSLVFKSIPFNKPNQNTNGTTT